MAQGVSLGLTSCYGRFWKREVGGRWKQQEGRQAEGTEPRRPVPPLRHVFIIQVSLSLQVPIIIPATMVLTSVYLVLAPIVAHPQPEFLYVFLFLLSGFLVYFLFVYFWYQPECLQVVTLHLQLLMEVAPTMKNAD